VIQTPPWVKSVRRRRIGKTGLTAASHYGQAVTGDVLARSLRQNCCHTLAEAKQVKALVQKALDEASDVLEDTTTGVA
jgi:predicted aminopeptidase